MRSRDPTLFTLAIALLAPGCGSDEGDGLEPALPDLQIATSLLPVGLVGAPYVAELIERGGAPPAVWRALDPLPLGLALSEAGALSGTPAEPGLRTVGFEVASADGQTARRPLRLEIRGDDDGPRPATSCRSPRSVEANGSAIPLSLDGEEDRERGGCSFGDRPEAVLVVELEEPSDLELDPDGARIFVRAEDCAAGRELFCDDDPGRLVDLEPGRYFVFVEADPSRAPEPRLRRAPPSPPAENARCVDALPLDPASGEVRVEASFRNVAFDPNDYVCGDPDRGLFYRFDLPAPAVVELDAGGADVDFALLRGDCVGPAVAACGERALCSPTLPAGGYVVRASARRPRDRLDAADLSFRFLPPRPAPPNDDPASAEPLEPGRPVSFTTADATPSGAALCRSTPVRGDVWYDLPIDERSDLALALGGAGSNDHYLSVFDPAGRLVGCDREVRLYGVPPAVYRVGVTRFGDPSTALSCDARSRGVGAVEVATSVSAPAPLEDTCAGAAAAPVRFPRGVDSVERRLITLLGASSDRLELDCRAGELLSAPDAVLRIEIPAPGGTLEVGLEGELASRSGLVVALTEGCDDQRARACGGFPNLRAPSLAPGVYHLWIDGTSRLRPGALAMTLALLDE